MFIDTPWHSFTEEEIGKVPISNGVYALYAGTDTIYFGKGEGIEGIRGRLKSHKSGYDGFCTLKAEYFNYEVTWNASVREKELLTEYNNLWHKLPKCNNVMP